MMPVKRILGKILQRVGLGSKTKSKVEDKGKLMPEACQMLKCQHTQWLAR